MYYRGGVKGQDLKWNCKRKQRQPLRKLYCRDLDDILSEFCLNGVSSCGCYVLERWLDIK